MKKLIIICLVVLVCFITGSSYAATLNIEIAKEEVKVSEENQKKYEGYLNNLPASTTFDKETDTLKFESCKIDTNDYVRVEFKLLDVEVYDEMATRTSTCYFKKSELEQSIKNYIDAVYTRGDYKVKEYKITELGK